MKGRAAGQEGDVGRKSSICSSVRLHSIHGSVMETSKVLHDRENEREPRRARLVMSWSAFSSSTRCSLACPDEQSTAFESLPSCDCRRLGDLGARVSPCSARRPERRRRTDRSRSGPFALAHGYMLKTVLKFCRCVLALCARLARKPERARSRSPTTRSVGLPKSARLELAPSHGEGAAFSSTVTLSISRRRRLQHRPRASDLKGSDARTPRTRTCSRALSRSRARSRKGARRGRRDCSSCDD